MQASSVQIHPTALIEPGVSIGDGTSVWDNVHIRGPAVIGQGCIIGEKTYIAYGVSIGNLVKINAQVYICTGITIEDRVMISAGVIFTNDRYPRAFDEDGGLADSGPTVDTLSTAVREGATIGAGATIGPGIVIGPFAMVGMGSVVAADVPAHGLVYGNPARLKGYVCVCGTRLRRMDADAASNGTRISCARCQRVYQVCIDSSGTPRPAFQEDNRGLAAR